jgi:hypothetical protein
MRKKLTTNEFIEKARKVHGDRYDYSNVLYITSHKKISVICQLHGIFYQSPDNHINKKCGCPLCRNIKMSKMFSDDIVSFIEKSKSVHGDAYDYSLVKYDNNYNSKRRPNRQKVKIRCFKHGVFNQTPNEHLNGCGCPKCSKNYKISKNTFLKRCKKFHKNKYDYSKINWVNTMTKVKILCKKHGYFYQSPYKHMNGNDCPRCVHRISKTEIKFLKYLKIPNTINNRQKYVNGYKVDGIKNNKIFEFLGDYYHGNPKKYDATLYNQICHKTFGELYNKTIEKFSKLNGLGYSIYYMWENDWNFWNKDKISIFPIKKYNGNKI